MQQKVSNSLLFPNVSVALHYNMFPDGDPFDGAGGLVDSVLHTDAGLPVHPGVCPEHALHVPRDAARDPAARLLAGCRHHHCGCFSS